MYKINIKKIDGYEDIPLPKKMSEFSSGYDLYAGVSENIVVPVGGRTLISTGFSLEMPKGIEAQIRPRSGLALKNGITLLNTPGTIDADYRGEIKVILINLGNEDFVIKPKDRIAQMVFIEVPDITLNQVHDLSDTNRGNGGFGHTGK